MITILTPTYNRGNTLPRLFKSLLCQTSYDFEWLVIDDGSSDNTKEIISTYRSQAPFEIIYKEKQNGGKHSALNLGFKLSNRDWIFLLDSDDWLKSDAIERIRHEINHCKDDITSICFLKMHEDGVIVGDSFPDDIDNYFERVYRGIKGDKADVLRRSTLDGFEFPEYSNENFMSESPLFIWLGKKGKTRFVNYSGYFCEYQVGGLSDSSVKNRHRCFNSSLYVYEKQYFAFNSFKLKFRSGVNWWRFRLFKREINVTGGRISALFLPFAFILYTIDTFKGNIK